MTADVQRWSKRRKMEVVLRLLRGESLDEVSRDVKVEISRLEEWRDNGIHGLEEAMKERAGDPMQAQLNEVNRRLGELMMENELLRIKASRAPGFPLGRSRNNGVIERFWKTLKKQVLEGRIYQTLADLRAALVVFMDLYNRAWRLEKLGGLTPDEARQAWETKQAA